VEELVYGRLLGRQHRVALLALVVTFAAFVAGIVAIPPRASAVAEIRRGGGGCPLWSDCNEWEHAGYVPLHGAAPSAGIDRPGP